MSAIVCVKDGDQLVLGADSRFMAHDFQSVSSDAAKKVFEVSPSTFIATSGFKMVCEFQEKRAPELSRELGTTDIRVLAEALAKESLPCLSELVGLLRTVADPHPRVAQGVSGESLLHGFVLAGRSHGELGYISVTFIAQGGVIVHRTEEYFGTDRIIFASLADLSAPFVNDIRIWTSKPAAAVGLILDTLKRHSAVIGGPNQIVTIDADGAHWVSRLAPQACVEVGQLDAATITASISITSPTITGGSISGGAITGGSLTGTSIAITTSSGDVSISSATQGINFVNGAHAGHLAYDILSLADSSGIVELEPTGLTLGVVLIADALLAPNILRVMGLPSSSPGSGTKQFWFDPADGNRVKFAP